MAMYEKQLTIDISGEGPYKHITAKQGDKKSRFYRITLVDCGKKITLTEDTKVDFRCTKPDENYCIIPTRKNDDGTVSFELDEQVLAVVGVVVSEFVITDDDGMILSTTVFYIHVLPSALSAYYIPSQSLQIMDRNLDMNGYGIRNLPEPTDDGDAVSKFYVDEQLKDVKTPVDETLDENSENAISNAAVAKEFRYIKDKAISKWYAMSVEKFKKEPWSLDFKIGKTILNDGQPEYVGFLGFHFNVAKGVGENQIITPLTDIPFEFNNDADKNSLNWTNKEKFPTLGIVSNQMGAEPVDLYKQIEAFVDGSIFYKSSMSMEISGYNVGYYNIGFAVSISSRIESAIETLIEELSQIIPTITHCCIAYENYEVIEANGIGE